MRWCRTGTSSGTRIWFWARIVCSASCPRSSSAQYPSVPRRARFRAALPAARLSPLVAGRSCSAAGDGAGLGELDSVMKLFFDVAATGTGESAIVADRLCTCYLAHIRGTRPLETVPAAQIRTISAPGPACAAGLLAVRISADMSLYGAFELSGWRLAPTATPKTRVPVLGSAELAVWDVRARVPGSPGRQDFPGPVVLGSH